MRGLSNLEYLWVNRLKLSDTTFDNLLNLGKLSISYSDFSNITDDAFKRIHNLEYLFISKSVNTSHLTFIDMPNLKLLDLDVWDSFHIEIFTNPTVIFLSIQFSEPDLLSCKVLGDLKNSKLQALHLKNCNFPHFDTNLLSGFTSLKNLKIELAKIESIKFSRNLSNLQTLILSSNRIKRFDSTILILSGLKSLDLSCGYFEPNPNMFMGLDHLERLNLSFCRGFGEIFENMFHGLHNLVDLNMSCCRLIRIHTDAFSHTPKLRKLNLSFNSLRLDNTGVLRHLTQLKVLELVLTQVQYSSIEKGLFSNLASLEVVNLTNNHINKIEKSNMFKNMKNLRKINI